MADQPTSIADSFPALQAAFQPDRAAGLDKTLQFDFSGREPGTWTMHIHDSTMDYAQGAAQSPNATIAVDSDDWLNILGGALDAVSAFMGGKLKIQGDMGLMMQFQNWFAR
ncbi:MAG TPA: SCP2 sterol-binding domain-containing protein [Ktedonobacterales bacterium]|jgi:putative sterol carrier protein|nr:SCP2 sterol-binding domain-containing protein [Ktedonobacterales bacterium]